MPSSKEQHNPIVNLDGVRTFLTRRDGYRGKELKNKPVKEALDALGFASTWTHKPFPRVEQRWDEREIEAREAEVFAFLKANS